MVVGENNGCIPPNPKRVGYIVPIHGHGLTYTPTMVTARVQEDIYTSSAADLGDTNGLSGGGNTAGAWAAGILNSFTIR